MTCEQCKKRGKTWDGSDPKCAFERGAFHPENWSCATVDALRDLVYEGQVQMPAGVDFRNSEDQKYATVKVDHIEGAGGALALWLTWYKNRCRTDGAWLMFSDQPPRPPTEAEVMAVVRHYRPNA